MVFRLFELVTQMAERFVGSFGGEVVDQPWGRSCAGVKSQLIADLYPFTRQGRHDPSFDGKRNTDDALLYGDIARDLIGVDVQGTGAGILRETEVDRQITGAGGPGGTDQGIKIELGWTDPFKHISFFR